MARAGSAGASTGTRAIPHRQVAESCLHPRLRRPRHATRACWPGAISPSDASACSPSREARTDPSRRRGKRPKATRVTRPRRACWPGTISSSDASACRPAEALGAPHRLGHAFGISRAAQPPPSTRCAALAKRLSRASGAPVRLRPRFGVWPRSHKLASRAPLHIVHTEKAEITERCFGVRPAFAGARFSG